MKILFCVFLLYCITSYSSAQWQFCGNYTGNVVQFEEKDTLLIAGTFGSGVYITSDGTNWTYSNNGMAIGQIISFGVLNDYIFAGAETEGVYRSSDNGYNWTSVNNGLSNLAIHSLSSDAGNLYAATSQGVNKTTNNGENWSRISPTYMGSIIFSVLAYSNKIIASSANGVLISTDGGANWNNISQGINSYVYCLTKFENTVFAGSSSTGVCKTTNDGLNWIQLGAGIPSGKAVRTIFVADGKIFAAVYNSGGIYYLPFSANNWIPANQGLAQLSCYTAIKFNNYIYAGTLSGIYRRPSGEFTSVHKLDGQIPDDYRLYQNNPNPFNPVTTIKYSIPEKSFVNLAVFDMPGRVVNTLINETQSNGVYAVTWDASSRPSGIYFCRFQTDKFYQTRKMVLIK